MDHGPNTTHNVKTPKIHSNPLIRDYFSRFPIFACLKKRLQNIAAGI
jgi:hypothetical protein